MPTIVTTAKLNQFMDAVVARLALSVKPKSGLNLIPTVPIVKRVLRLGDFTGATKPLLAVQVMGWNAEPQGANRLFGTLRFAVHVLIDSRDGDEVELLNVCTDVVRAMLIDVTLGGLVTYTFPVEFTPNVDASSNTGYASAAVVFESLYQWDAATP
jgi:hypothetical protein